MVGEIAASVPWSVNDYWTPLCWRLISVFSQPADDILSLQGPGQVRDLPVGFRWMLMTSHLNENLPQGDEGRAELSHEQAADEEIPLVLSEELRNRRAQAEQTSL